MIVPGVGCHPDDLGLHCGGTLRKYLEQGADVSMCHEGFRPHLASCRLSAKNLLPD